ncbi:hypothetical protein [Methylorubrum extorquens]
MPPLRSTVPPPCADVELWLNDARVYLYIGPSTRISKVVTIPGDRPHARSEIAIRPITTFARETPGEVVRAPCVERGSGPPD